MENKETRKENGDSPEKKNRERTPLTEAQRLKRQKMIVLPAMVLVFIGAMWLIFAPSSDKEEQPGATGYNTEIPDADKDNRKIIGDKVKAYEQGEMEERRASRNHAMQELGSMFDREVSVTGNNPDFDLASPGGVSDTDTASSPASQTIRSSATAYRDLNATLGNFYDQPKNDNAEMDELLERIASLESELESERGKASSMDEQVALMEKSYELAAKYMNGQDGQRGQIAQIPTAGQNGGGIGTPAIPVQAIRETTVSGLQQPMSDADFIRAYSQPRNYGFNTAVGTGYAMGKNTVAACIHQDQTLVDGQAVKLRLLEPMQAGNIVVPKNTLVAGTAKVQGERLDILVSSIEYAGNIIPVELAVFDTDGQKGLSVPSSMEQEAFNEAMANIGSGLGTSISFAQSAGQQVAMDVTRGLLQGTSGYLAKKFRTVKVKLKAGYKVMLYAKQQ